MNNSLTMLMKYSYAAIINAAIFEQDYFRLFVALPENSISHLSLAYPFFFVLKILVSL